MQKAFLTLLSLVCLLAFNVAQAEVTGRVCKDHLKPIFKINEDRYLYNELIAIPEYTDLKNIPLKTFRDDTSYNDRVRDYMKGVRSTVSQCSQYCKDVPFNMDKVRQVAASLGLAADLFNDQTKFNCDQLENDTIYSLESFMVAIDDDAKPGVEITVADADQADFVDGDLTVNPQPVAVVPTTTVHPPDTIRGLTQPTPTPHPMIQRWEEAQKAYETRDQSAGAEAYF